MRRRRSEVQEERRPRATQELHGVIRQDVGRVLTGCMIERLEHPIVRQEVVVVLARLQGDPIVPARRGVRDVLVPVEVLADERVPVPRCIQPPRDRGAVTETSKPPWGGSLP